MNYDYLAGIIDGEGTIGLYHSIKKNEYVPYISISSTNENLLIQIQHFLLVDNIKSRISKRKPRNVHHKMAYGLELRHRPAIQLANIIKDKLIIKKNQANILAIDYDKCTIRNGKYTKEMLKSKQNLIIQIKSLNSRGV